ncbi:MAG TPA: hypothetical protein VH054_26855 [Polyangiaceae bacterium]|nr:hypothetical protein [Polyangiaceae bacterium]
MRRLWLAWGLAAACSSACSFDGLDDYSKGSDAGAQDVTAADVGNPIDAQVDQAPPVDAAPDTTAPPCNLASPFGAPTPLSTLNTSKYEAQAELSPDGLTIYFESDRLNAGLNVFTASRPSTSSAFGSVAPRASLDFSGADTWNVTLTADGLTAYVVTDQNAADHMYKATRASSLASFGTPTLMPSSIVKGEQPFVRPDGLVLYFSDKSGPKGQVAHAVLSGPTVTDLPLVVAGNLDLGIPVVNAGDTLLYFAVYDASNANSTNTYDIWMASRASQTDAWGTPVAVTELNTNGFDVPSWLSADGCELYFTRAPNGSGNADMYSARRP